MFDSLLKDQANVTLAGVPDGAESYALARLLAETPAQGLALVFVARDATRMAMISEALGYFDPAAEIIQLPAWDCLPYDRVSPNPAISARRLLALGQLARGIKAGRKVLLVTTLNAAVQRIPERAFMAEQTLSMAPGNQVDMAAISKWLEMNGFSRTPTVRETGEYAVRGGIVDLFAPGEEEPVRLDFFGDTLESIRSFNPETQRTSKQLKRLDLVPMSEVVLSEESISRFRRSYLASFGAASRDDVLYQSISDGRRYAGMEHWLPLFHDKLETLFDFIGDTPVVLDASSADAVRERLDQIAEHYKAREEAREMGSGAGTVPYMPVPPEKLYFTPDEWTAALADRATATLDPFTPPPGSGKTVIELGGRQGRSFAAERTAGDVNIFDALTTHVRDIQKSGKRTVIACWSDGSRDRLGQILGDHGLGAVQNVETLDETEKLPAKTSALCVLGIEHGFELSDIAFIGEQDILGDRLVRKSRRKSKGANVITEATGLSEGDLVVHVEHGIGRFIGLKTVEAIGAPHDCLELQYAGGDKLYLPVENIELLSRYGSEDQEAQLDKLGGGAWQARKAKLKKRILEIADGLIKTAAERALKTAPVVETPEGVYDEFATKFPYEETDDQLNAIDSVFEDLASGRPMDRLVCGDVGFGKTEVALRAAFLAAMSGRQVAVVVPTTLLARQHFKTFSERFHGLPINVAHASRLVPTRQLTQTKKGIADGSVDIVVGTHALLGKSIQFRDLGLLIIDEEQHFGVKHKERLKELKSDIHVLTLSATPIPRTLVLTAYGDMDVSKLDEKPAGRKPVATVAMPIARLDELLNRIRTAVDEGRKIYWICPLVEDSEEVPVMSAEARHGELAGLFGDSVGLVHGRMAGPEKDAAMAAFKAGETRLLVATTVIEVGVDVPDAQPAHLVPDDARVVVEERDDGEPTGGEPGVRGERAPEVAHPDDGDGPVAGEPELPGDLEAEVGDVVAHAADAVGAEVGEITSELGRPDTAGLGELLGAHAHRAGRRELPQGTQVPGESGDGGIGDATAVASVDRHARGAPLGAPHGLTGLGGRGIGRLPRGLQPVARAALR